MDTKGYKKDTQNEQNEQILYYCKYCDHTSKRQSNYIRHLSTTKHKNNTKGYKKDTQNEQNEQKANMVLELLNSKSLHHKSVSQKGAKRAENEQKTSNCNRCECGKEFKWKQGLYKHRKICYMYQGDISSMVLNDQSNDVGIKDLIMSLVQENKDVQLQMQKNFMELIPHIHANNSHNIINNTTHNTQNFNVNMFLNEHCKNAMNLTDFIDTLPITDETYNYTIENGLTKTITNMVVDGLNNMDVLERPIHCTDTKRKIMYVKDNNVWEKDTELNKIQVGIKGIALKQRTMINKWQDANDGWDKDENLQTKLTKLVFNSMTSIEDDEKETNKIIRAIGKNTYLSNDIKDVYK